MGWYAQKITVNGSRSAHNSLQDDTDKAAWQYLLRSIQRLVESEPEFEKLSITVDASLD